MDDRIRIRDAIQNGRIQEATSLVNQLHPELLDNDRYLYFHLQVGLLLSHQKFYTHNSSACLFLTKGFCFQQLHLIELIRSGQVEEALSFAQNHLSEAGEADPAVLNELERTLALLAFDEPTQSPFSDLLLPTHRQKVFLLFHHCLSDWEPCVLLPPLTM